LFRDNDAEQGAERALLLQSLFGVAKQSFASISNFKIFVDGRGKWQYNINKSSIAKPKEEKR